MAEQKITEKDLQRLEEVFNPQCDVCVLVRAYRAQQQTIEELKRKNGKMARDLAVNQDTINTLRRTIEAQTVEIKRLNSQEIIDVYRNSAIEANAHSARLMQEIAQLKARYELSNPHLRIS
jgi:adenylosuccinate lyase